MTNIEDQVRVVLRSQADAMQIPDARADVQLAHVTEMPARHGRSRALLVAAAAVLVIASVVALAQRRSDPSATADATPFHFETPTVLLDAASVQVDAAGQTFVPSADLRVEGDPGVTNDYTTLELTWHERGIEQRINIYFASDGTDWWANEIRTYDGQPNGEWIEPMAVGEFFKSPLGVAYVGDLDLPNLHIKGMTLEAFRRPSACSNAGQPIALIADFPTIRASAGGFGATLQVFDATTCTALSVGSYTFDYTSDDPTVAGVTPQQPVIPDYPPMKTRVDLQLLAPGTTTIHVVAKDGAGNVAGTADMNVTVLPAADEALPLDTAAVPAPTTAPALPLTGSPSPTFRLRSLLALRRVAQSRQTLAGLGARCGLRRCLDQLGGQ